MNDLLQYAVVGLSLLVAAVATTYVVLDRPTDRLPLALLGLLELALVALTVDTVVALAGPGHDDVNALVLVGYLLGTLLFVPVATVWALGERSRAGTAALIVLGLVVPVLVVRVDQVWAAGG